MKECATHLEVLALTFWLSYETIPSAVIDRKSENLSRIAAEDGGFMSKFASLSVSLREGRRFSDPINPNRFSFVGLMPVQEILKFQPGQIPWVNPRNPNPKSQMARTIVASVVENRGKFHLLNRGVTIIAEDGN